MKRRNVEIGKMRRPMKRNKITEGIYGSTVLYVKFLLLWVFVILADFLLEFRFEFLWPFYLLLRSVYDSFKYQGLAFSLFFVCVALTSDMLCYCFIPVHWLFFAASTYVWVQYVWHTDRGICAPTIILWVLFVYLEAAVRLRDVKHMPGHMDLCRPFAAHCIGYPVVTLGFGFKSYIGFRMRQRKQRDVAKENEFYLQLMQQALPVDTATSTTTDVADQQQQENHTNTVVHNNTHNHNNNTTSGSGKLQQNSRQSHERNGHVMNGVGALSNGVGHASKSHNRRMVERSREHEHEHRHADRQRVNHVHSNGTAIGAGCTSPVAEESVGPATATNNNNTVDVSQTETRHNVSAPLTRRRDKKELDREREATEYLQRLELDTKRLRTDLQNSRQSEQELRLQVASLTTSDKVAKGELTAMQRELEEMQSKLQNALNCKASDRQAISNLERRLADERRNRSNCETQLAQERKNRKAEEARAAQAAAAAAAQSTRTECTEQCKSRRRELETEVNELRTAKHWAEERCTVLERENATLAEQLRDTEILMSALATMQEKNAHLENSLSAETRIKLDLFSALGEAKRQLEIRESTNRAQEKEIEELKSKIAQVLAVMPNDAFGSPAPPTNNISRVRLAESPPGSTLDPNATAYTPKSSLIASTEA